MDVLVVLRQVPDLVEDLELNAAGTDLERDSLKYVLNEFDDWALEQALLLKEKNGALVTVLAPDLPEADTSLYTALAKGADRAAKVSGDFVLTRSSHALADILAPAIRVLPHDVVLTGVQSAEDLDGQLAVLLGSYLGYPAVSVVTDVAVDGSSLIVRKEFAGGLCAEYEVALPCVLGIQAAVRTPRYAPVSRVRAVSKEKKIEVLSAGGIRESDLRIVAFRKPEGGRRADMITGDPDSVAQQIVAILRQRGLLKRSSE